MRRWKSIGRAGLSPLIPMPFDFEDDQSLPLKPTGGYPIMSSVGPVKPTAVSRTTRITQVSTSNCGSSGKEEA